MKRISLIAVIISFAMLFSSCVTFDSYYNSIDVARKEDKYAEYYSEDSLIFSKDVEGGIVDFIIHNDNLHIVCIAKKDSSKDLFKIKSLASFSIDEQIQDFNNKQQYNYHESTQLAGLKYSWCIVTKEYNDNNDKIASFEFEYNNQIYNLCIKI